MAISEVNFPKFSTNNSYYPLINNSIALEYVSEMEAQCLPGLATCAPFEDGHYADCIAVELPCAAVDNNFSQYYPSNYSTHDIRQPATRGFPPKTYIKYLQDPEIMKRIGTNVTYSECSDDVANTIDNLDDGDSLLAHPYSDIPSNIAQEYARTCPLSPKSFNPV